MAAIGPQTLRVSSANRSLRRVCSTRAPRGGRSATSRSKELMRRHTAPTEKDCPSRCSPMHRAQHAPTRACIACGLRQRAISAWRPAKRAHSKCRYRCTGHSPRSCRSRSTTSCNRRQWLRCRWSVSIAFSKPSRTRLESAPKAEHWPRNNTCVQATGGTMCEANGREVA